MKFLRTLLIAHAFLIGFANLSTAEDALRSVPGISYYPAETKIEDPEKRCVVDLKVPTGQQGFSTLVWFHGGGLTGGSRDFPQFEGKGVALISAGYRFSPQVKCPVFIEDAAAAVAWTVKHIAEYGGDPKKVFVGGHSAGGYLTLMLGMDPRWLKPYELTPMSLAGLLPVSAQVTTHFHVKELLKIPGPSLLPVIDDFAPLHYSSKDLPPICLITGDRRIEFKSRVEENELLYITLKNLEHPNVEFHELKDLDHATVPQGAAKIMPVFISRIAAGAPPQADEPVRVVVDDTQPGFRDLTTADFAKVNSADDTWTWKDGVLQCNGTPVSVLRTAKEYRNFEMVVEWCHQHPAGNSGLFVWATPESIDNLATAGKPGLPSGIEVQILDHAFTDEMKTAGKATDWFGTNGDVFAVGTKMTPFPPLSPNGSRSFPRKHLAKGHGEWNHYYIRGINGEIRLWVNGEEVSGGNGCEPDHGYLCLESEGSPILFRKLRIRELP